MKEYDGKPYCELWRCVMNTEELRQCNPRCECWGKAELCREEVVENGCKRDQK